MSCSYTALVRARDDVHVEWVDNEAVVLDPETSELHYLNTPAALVFALIQEHGFEGGLEALHASQGVSGDNPEVKELLDDMVEKGLLVND